MDLRTALADVVQRFGDKTAFKMGERSLSFRQLGCDSKKVAAGLTALGIMPGDRVALILENSPDFPVIYFGIVSMGAVVVPLDTKYKWLELQTVFENCRPVMVIAEGVCLKAIASELQSLPYIKHKLSMGAEALLGFLNYQVLLNAETPTVDHQPQDSDTAHLAYTSGPTLRARGAVISHGALFTAARISAGGFGQNETDRVLLFALPMHHMMGIVVIMATSILCGSMVVILPGISMEGLLKTIEREQITIFHGVPFIHAMLVNHLKKSGLQVDIRSLRFCGSAGAPIPVGVIRDFEDLTGINLIQYYGLTETTGHVSCQDIHHSGQSGSVGPALEGFEVRVVDCGGRDVAAGERGEVIVRGPIMGSYYNDTNETAYAIRDGWLYTDDWGVFDERGELYITGVKKPMLITKGQNIYFSDLEDLLKFHPAVADVAACGIADPDGMRGEVALVAVKLRPGMQMSEQEVKKYTLERLANYKTPKKVVFMDSIPRRSDGWLDTTYIHGK